ncbi:hypothetical protein [Micromonospora avicenniae]|uniref:DUF5642 domain-containing protein n=1 Tax=Micromonospora avicenniae TaxID=1198245 RepID=A0A1N7FA66_9ACTN|nr:hypothetical protein [Micromonospora avicenniae]SIR97227.1 hypothetical protein SAMN05444858_13240 [Micromonospora avicenniae]
MRGAYRNASRGRPTTIAAGLLALGVLAGCSSEGPAPVTKPPYTVDSVRSGLVSPEDLGDGAIEIEDEGHSSHVIYTPPNSIPTCPYVQRSENVEVAVEPAIEPVGGNPTGRTIVAPQKVGPSSLPVVTQGAVVFQSSSLVDDTMNAVVAEANKCPATFSVLGGPPTVVGEYKVGSRPIEINGWKGFAQHLVHTSPPEVNPETYDDLVTVVVRKANAIIYVGYTQIKSVGKRADSDEKVKALMKTTLARLG